MLEVRVPLRADDILQSGTPGVTDALMTRPDDQNGNLCITTTPPLPTKSATSGEERKQAEEDEDIPG